MEKLRGLIRTKNGGFSGIVKAQNKDPSLLASEQRRKQPRENYSHLSLFSSSVWWI